jgi:hypothetical protein
VLKTSAERFTINSFYCFAIGNAPAHRAEVKLRRISRRRFDAKMPLKIGEPRCRETGECSDSIGRQEVPVPRLPRGTQPLITREAELQQRYECWRKNEEPHDLAVARDECMTLQEQFTNGERASNDLAEEHSTTAAVEHRIYGVIGGAI